MFSNRFVKKPDNYPKKITLLGSCFANFTVNQYLIRKSINKKQAFEVQTNVLQQRSDVIVDLINDITPNQDIIRYFLDKKEGGEKKILIQGKKVDHAKWFANHLMQKIDAGKNVKDDVPDIIVMDSLCDIRHNLYKHKKEKWKVLLGEMVFNDPKITVKFKEEFEFIGLISPSETANNVEKVYDFFYQKNRFVKLFYIHFPIDTQYLEQRWFDRGQEIKKFTSGLKNIIHANYFIDIEIPPDLVKPIADSSHPNYSSEIWNHFYPETYEYCSKKILGLSKHQHTV